MLRKKKWLEELGASTRENPPTEPHVVGGRGDGVQAAVARGSKGKACSQMMASCSQLHMRQRFLVESWFCVRRRTRRGLVHCGHTEGVGRGCREARRAVTRPADCTHARASMQTATEREGGRERGGGGGGDTNTHRERDRDRDRDRGRQRQTETDREREREREGETATATATEIETDGQTETESNRATEQQRPTGRQKETSRVGISPASMKIIMCVILPG